MMYKHALDIQNTRLHKRTPTEYGTRFSVAYCFDFVHARYATSRGDTRSDISPAASSAPMLHASATSRSRSSKRVRWLVMLTRTTSWPLMRVVDGAAMPRS
eukprot:scaffold31825_cov60-Phaeocystis_antarctica.AAC.3